MGVSSPIVRMPALATTMSSLPSSAMRRTPQPVPPGTRGRLYFRDTSGYGMRYLRGGVDDPFAGPGEFTLGEIGVMDDAGYVWVTDRFADMVVSGGVNIYPAEIEGYINDMPGVAESALVGVPHPDFGEVGVAVVIAKPGTQLDGEQIVGALKSQLANFKIPKRCFVATELPRNTMGKVQKKLLRDQYAREFA